MQVRPISNPPLEPSAVQPKRREARIPAELNVRVLGMDVNGKPFHQPAITKDISASGAKLTALAAEPRVGDIIGVQSSGAKNRFEVVWVKRNSDGTFEIGLSAVEQGNSPWRSMFERHTAGTERRSEERFPCSGSVTLRAAGFSSPIWGSIRDISAGGCYVQAVNVPNDGEVVSGQFVIAGVQINAVAIVCSARTAVGMGLRWCDLGFGGQERLDTVLGMLSSSNGEQDAVRTRVGVQIDKLHQLIVAMKERASLSTVRVEPTILAKLQAAQEALVAALKSLQ